MYTHVMIVNNGSGLLVLQPLGELVVGNALELVHPVDVMIHGHAIDHLRSGHVAHEALVDLLGTLGVQ